MELDEIGRDDAQLKDIVRETAVHSKLEGPIESLSFLRKSLLFAELASLSYASRGEAGRLANAMGLPETRYYDRHGAQAYLFGNDHDAVVVCRGTEPNQWNDIRADLDAASVVAETAGRVHRGFKREMDDLWPRLEKALASNERPLWFAGHSLGGAMAAICAGRCKLSQISSNPRALFTFGAPRVGNKRYVSHTRIEYYRWVNNNDVVPRVPPRWMGYRHSGTEVYLNRKGQISRVRGVWKARDRWWGFVRGLTKWRIDQFSDHFMGDYLRAILAEIDEEESGYGHPFCPPNPLGDDEKSLASS
ncbi:Lipase (class 3) [Pirellulimonas nuda]|uniref:Lipase (Class 3) n=1 Tax=Pirellulimonas nuda TaxID=2528009 RepID=A0A518DH23_9BACT|nr:lipase family protein [Pirellulimonas nuda]QDU90775.1 Lipase (class 3) [Pirellulimonas nuda]